jgi:hypothetical protein
VTKKRLKKQLVNLDQVIGANGALAIFGIVPSTFRAACQKGRIPCKKIGRDWVALLPDCERIWKRLDILNDETWEKII